MSPSGAFSLASIYEANIHFLSPRARVVVEKASSVCEGKGKRSQTENRAALCRRAAAVTQASQAAASGMDADQRVILGTFLLKRETLWFSSDFSEVLLFGQTCSK